DSLLSSAEQSFLEISEGRPRDNGFINVDSLLKGAIDRIEELYESGNTITGVTTGFTDLDEKTSGWQRADLIVVAARPSMGKTALALNMVESALFSTDQPVLIFSMEMPADSLVMRLLASIGRIQLKHIRDGNLTGDDWDKLAKAAAKLKGRKLFIDDTPGLTPTDVRARVRRLAREQGSNPAMVMLDYLQLMTTAGPSEGRVQEISEISRSMKQVAREFDCPMLALSQLNRGVEQRPNKRPMNSDLRESGAIEQDADVILFIYRDDYYNEDSQDKGIAELIIGKQRNGEIGTVRLQFQGEYTRFNNLAPEFRAPEHD
ncbi:MAG: replicative DNA helicase, partial [Pseudohongiellaceae bacterium]